jgi:hypothetical protein
VRSSQRDIYDYMRSGEMPINLVPRDPNKEDGGRAFAARAAALDKGTDLLPKIKELGERQVGLYNHPLLTFFGADDVVNEGALITLTTSVQRNFDNFLLEAILSNVPRTIDALMHAVSWGDPDIVHNQHVHADRAHACCCCCLGVAAMAAAC